VTSTQSSRALYLANFQAAHSQQAPATAALGGNRTVRSRQPLLISDLMHKPRQSACSDPYRRPNGAAFLVAASTLAARSARKRWALRSPSAIRRSMLSALRSILLS